MDVLAIVVLDFFSLFIYVQKLHKTRRANAKMTHIEVQNCENRASYIS